MAKPSSTANAPSGTAGPFFVGSEQEMMRRSATGNDWENGHFPTCPACACTEMSPFRVTDPYHRNQNRSCSPGARSCQLAWQANRDPECLGMREPMSDSWAGGASWLLRCWLTSLDCRMAVECWMQARAQAQWRLWIADRMTACRVVGIDPSKEYVDYANSRNRFPDRVSFLRLHFGTRSGGLGGGFRYLSNYW